MHHEWRPSEGRLPTESAGATVVEKMWVAYRDQTTRGVLLVQKFSA